MLGSCAPAKGLGDLLPTVRFITQLVEHCTNIAASNIVRAAPPEIFRCL